MVRVGGADRAVGLHLSLRVRDDHRRAGADVVFRSAAAATLVARNSADHVAPACAGVTKKSRIR